MEKLILIRAGGTTWHNGLPTADESRIQGTVPLPLTEQAKKSLQKICEKNQQAKLPSENPHCICRPDITASHSSEINSLEQFYKNICKRNRPC